MKKRFIGVLAAAGIGIGEGCMTPAYAQETSQRVSICGCLFKERKSFAGATGSSAAKRSYTGRAPITVIGKDNYPGGVTKNIYLQNLYNIFKKTCYSFSKDRWGAMRIRCKV